jgi:hypothetical protein
VRVVDAFVDELDVLRLTYASARRPQVCIGDIQIRALTEMGYKRSASERRTRPVSQGAIHDFR